MKPIKVVSGASQDNPAKKKIFTRGNNHNMG